MDPLTIGALALSGGGTILGLLDGEDEEERREPFPGYGEKLSGLLDYAMTKARQPGTRSDVDFSLKPTDVGNATRARILGQLESPTTYEGYSKELSQDLYKTRKARLAESYADENKRQSEMYNRLGLATSTPYLQAAQDLGRRQATDEDLIAAEMAKDEYDRAMEARKFGDTLGLQYTQLGNILGQQDIAGQEYTQGARYADFARAEEQPLEYARLASGILGGAGSYYTPTYTPSTGAQLGMAGQDIGSLLLLYQLLGKK